ncbi:MAG: DUF4402 domain-containing protein [Daejeonella sp.]|uniref:DUF4402 domain-containing protein n=1 Tax=Daejeonella sp. TaxID=2805397 RepID=UPI003C779FE9
MKNFTKLFALAFVMIGFTTIASAQTTSPAAAASATVITPITVSKTTDLSFGNLAVQSATGGTLVLTPAAGRSATGGVTLPAVTGTVAAATFKVDGEGTSAYSITLPTASFNLTSGLNTMAVGSFTSTPSANGALVAGTQNVNVGATLTVAAAQAAGSYTNTADLKIIVNYN